MWFIGHFALGYFVAQIINRFTKEKLILPLIFVFSIIPDIDVLIPELLHRSLTHSIILAALLFVPIILITKRGFPYLGALASHSLIGDFFIGSSFQLLWPASNAFFGSSYPFSLFGISEIFTEVGLFIAMTFFIMQASHKKRRLDGNTVRIFGIEF